ncbi:leukotriene B4 receptor 1-like [Polymixia lowei]
MSVHLWISALDSNSTLQNQTTECNSSCPPTAEQSRRNAITPCVLLTLCFLVGLPSNLAVIIDISRKFKRYASNVNKTVLLLVLNLAVADSITVGCAPLSGYVLIGGWTMGHASCAIFFYLLTCCLYVSVFTVTGMSVNFFIVQKFAVANPKMMGQVRGRRRVLMVIGGIWTLAALLSIPALFTRQVVEKRGLLRCIRRAATDTGKVVVLLMETLLGFVLPFSILLTSYIWFYKSIPQARTASPQSTDQRTKIARLVVSILVTFLICWTPFHIVNLVDVSTTLLQTSSPHAYDSLKVFRNAAGDALKSLCLVGSCINPFLYAFTLWKKLNQRSLSSGQTDVSEMCTSTTT